MNSLPGPASSIRSKWLELHSQCQLHRAWSTGLIERAEASLGASASQAHSQHLDGLSKLSDIVQPGNRIREIRVVEDIEELRPQLKVDLLRQIKLAAYCQIQLRHGKTAQRVAA